MEISVADAAGKNLDQHLAGAWNGNRSLFDGERLAERANDSGFHGLVPGARSFSRKKGTSAHRRVGTSRASIALPGQVEGDIANDAVFVAHDSCAQAKPLRLKLRSPAAVKIGGLAA
jgi:hypothetical protein